MIGVGTKPKRDKKALGSSAQRGFVRKTSGKSSAAEASMSPINTGSMCSCPKVSKVASWALITGMDQGDTCRSGRLTLCHTIACRTVSVGVEDGDGAPSPSLTMASERCTCAGQGVPVGDKAGSEQADVEVLIF